ncbi:MAG: hypothetical protein PHR14_02470 [Oscillospiraceae bacterium]|nr:hypothetical protein [Oscillospiraceae bacterium]
MRDLKRKLQVDNANRDEFKKRMADMSTFLKKQSAALTEYDEQLVRPADRKGHRLRGQIHRGIQISV